jgi:AcrR family transcriptional regulator
MAVKRNYHSVVRAEQREQTARRLLEAFGDMLREGEQEITIPRVARRAQVSAPTAYKHYPTVEALVEAYWEQPEVKWIPPSMASLERLPEIPVDLFRKFEQHKAWLKLVNAGGDVAMTGRRTRTRLVTEGVAELLGPMPPASMHLLPRVIRHLTSFNMWIGLTEGLELSSDEAADVSSWLLRLVVQELARNPLSLEEHLHAQANLRP